MIVLYLNRAPRSVPPSAQSGVPDFPLVVLNVQASPDAVPVVTSAARESGADFIFLHQVRKSDLSAYTAGTGSLPAAFHGGSAILSRHPLYEQGAAGDGGVRAVAVSGGKKFAVICSPDAVSIPCPFIRASPQDVQATGWRTTKTRAEQVYVYIKLEPQ